MEQEQLRHQYLEALGVSSWLPCAKLPGAADSAAWVSDFQHSAPDIPFESAGTSHQSPNALAPQKVESSNRGTTTSVAIAAAHHGVSQARAALGLTSSEEISTIESQPTVGSMSQSVVSAPPSPVEHVVEESSSIKDELMTSIEPPRFKLAYFRIGELLVVDSVPPQGGHFGENYKALARSIAEAVGFHGEEGAMFILPWPTFASKTLDQGYQQASIAVQYKLFKELRASQIKAVLLFGEAASQMVMERHESIEQLKGICFEVRVGVKAIGSYSLTEAMQLPGIKKQVWRDLQPLLKSLSADLCQ